MSTTNVHTIHLKLIIAVLLLFALLSLPSCSLFQSQDKHLTHVRGRVTIEGETDYSGIHVQVQYGTSYGPVVLAATMTNDSGYFDMEYVPFVPEQVKFEVFASKDGYSFSRRNFAIYFGYDGSPFVFNDMQLHGQKKMMFEWAWKEGDGSSFVGVETGQGTVYSYVADTSRNWRYSFGPDNDNGSQISFRDNDVHSAMVFCYQRLVDAGLVPLVSVASVPTTGGCRNCGMTMQVGHTYIVQTEHGYAKFHVISLGNAE